MFEIEKGIRIPEKRAGSPRYPFANMEVGDSFLIPRDNGDVGASRNRAMNAALRLRPKRFKSRAVETGVRIWRIE